MATTAPQTQITVGTRVQRKSGRQVVGIVERIYTNTYTGKRKAVVRWIDSYAKFGGGTRDNHSAVAVTSLRVVA